ncbi:23S ribosomal RNA methyltransferase Erm [Microbacterium hydrocarbonoxydans]|uniref:23S ribosomal RNA methyltransferase Erm n=1 Tax=Microbacterium hydrocarbonoxydans TaxID=273678 RepID=UPI002040723E|nr:23S ribosomal RNA methyltransferase Erm [Microbacterium hydrocarbonoxydans]MCM3781162.1 23S ribosomal RNA methyltransferase Erm [Microbacterium hydrocarbonoxydans]
MPRSHHGGRHELGQNFLTHTPTVDRIVSLVGATSGSILELGAGDGALTRPLARLGRPLTALELDEHRAKRLDAALPRVTVRAGDALRHPLNADVVVGNIPFHLTTPILRRMLSSHRWTHAVLLTQWEVARKRAGVGGGTMMTAQVAPWFTAALEGRVPAWAFTPQPSVDGGLLTIARRDEPLVSPRDRRAYEAFVRAVFTARGASLTAMVSAATHVGAARARAALREAGAASRRLPRDLRAEEWVGLWRALSGSRRS